MKILIIKLGAKGDVVRTLPILNAIKEIYPNSEISWITKKESETIIKTSPQVNKVYTIPFKSSARFDLLYNFDIEKEATDLANKINAKNKFGFRSENGFVSSFNLGAEYYLNTLFDDYIKKTNKLTYQEMMFKAAGLEYKKQYHPIYLTERDKKYAEDFAKKNKINPKKLVGIHTGSSPRWPSKSWSEEKIKEFIKQAKQKDYEILLFGGPNEIGKHKKISEDLKKQGIKIIQNNPNNSDNEFFALVNLCSKMVCSDSFALHVSLALNKPTIALFFCTSPHEVEGYELLKKIVSPLIYDFFPEKSDQYNEELVNSISVEEVLKTLLSLE